MSEELELAGEIVKLGNFLIQEVDGEPSQSESAVDCAIRLIRATKKDPKKDTFTFEETEYIEAKAANLSTFTLNPDWIATYKQLAEAAYSLKTRIDRATVKDAPMGTDGVTRSGMELEG